MNHRITRSSQYKIYLQFLSWLRASLDRLGQRIFAAADGFAHEHDWQIISAQAGLGRRYRDPRFDSLARCQRCGGRGARAAEEPCQTCKGTGRVILAAQATCPSRRRSS